jgi:hypothetical protein
MPSVNGASSDGAFGSNPSYASEILWHGWRQRVDQAMRGAESRASEKPNQASGNA